jgi:hypothetical protein
MNILRGIWRDIKKGENIDLYITVLIAFAMGIVSLLDYADPKLTTAIILAALGILTASALRDKHAHEKAISHGQKIQEEIKRLESIVNESMQRTNTNRANEVKLLQKLSVSTENILEKVTVSHSIIEAGLTDIIMQPRNINWDELFEKANEIDVFFTYARTWRNANSNLLDKFVRREGNRLRIVLPNPQSDVILQELSNRFTKSPEEFHNLIDEATRDYSKLNEIGQKFGAKVELWHASATPMFTIYRFDKSIILTLGSYKDTKGDVPHFICETGGLLYKYAIEEFSVLIGEDGRLISKRIF